MTKSRIALSKINCSVWGRSGSRLFDFHRTSARFEPEKNTSGKTQSRSTADEQTSRVPRCVKRKSSRERIFSRSGYAPCAGVKLKPARPHQLRSPKNPSERHRALATSRAARKSIRHGLASSPARCSRRDRQSHPRPRPGKHLVPRARQTDHARPLRQLFAGSCGCVIRFENPQAKSAVNEGVNLAERQRGVAGEITASRRVRVFARQSRKRFT
jgi:hypothetical protein